MRLCRFRHFVTKFLQSTAAIDFSNLTSRIVSRKKVFKQVEKSQKELSLHEECDSK